MAAEGAAGIQKEAGRLLPVSLPERGSCTETLRKYLELTVWIRPHFPLV